VPLSLTAWSGLCWLARLHLPVWEKLGKLVSGRAQAVRHIVERLNEADNAGQLGAAEQTALTAALRELTTS